MNKRRPVNLDLTTIQFPVPAIVSILHRISGVVLFFVIPFILCTLKKSLHSEADFGQLISLFNQTWIKLILVAMFAALIYHLIAGIRHLLMDAGIGESLEGGRLSAKIILVLAIVITLIVGVWLW